MLTDRPTRLGIATVAALAITAAFAALSIRTRHSAPGFSMGTAVAAGMYAWRTVLTAAAVMVVPDTRLRPRTRALGRTVSVSIMLHVAGAAPSIGVAIGALFANGVWDASRTEVAAAVGLIVAPTALAALAFAPSIFILKKAAAAAYLASRQVYAALTIIVAAVVVVIGVPVAASAATAGYRIASASDSGLGGSVAGMSAADFAAVITASIITFRLIIGGLPDAISWRVVAATAVLVAAVFGVAVSAGNALVWGIAAAALITEAAWRLASALAADICMVAVVYATPPGTPPPAAPAVPAAPVAPAAPSPAAPAAPSPAAPVAPAAPAASTAVNVDERTPLLSGKLAEEESESVADPSSQTELVATTGSAWSWVGTPIHPLSDYREDGSA